MDTYKNNEHLGAIQSEERKYEIVFKNQEEPYNIHECLKNKMVQRVKLNESEEYRLCEEEANKSEFAETLLRNGQEKINYEAFRANVNIKFKTLGFSDTDITIFLNLISSIKSMPRDSKLVENNILVEMAKQAEIFLKLASRGNLSAGSLFFSSVRLHAVIDDCITELKNETDDSFWGRWVKSWFDDGVGKRISMLDILNELKEKANSVFLELINSTEGRIFSEDNTVSEREKKLKETVENLVRSWTPNEDYKDEGGNSVDVSGIVSSLKNKLVAPESNLLVYLFPQHQTESMKGDIQDDGTVMKNCLVNERTCFFSEVLVRFAKGLDQLMGDVVYWATKKKAVCLKGFELDASDLHERGLGVCIITLGLREGEEKYVIKPDKREFEHALLNPEEGFVRCFNEKVSDNGGEAECKVIPIKMETDEKHGTLVEFIDYLKGEGKKNKPVDNVQKKFTCIFCTLFGIYDLTHQNLVYSNSNPANAILLDAECGFGLESIGNLSEIARVMNVNEILDGKSTVEFTVEDKSLLNILYDRFLNATTLIKVRKLIISTEDFGGLRQTFHVIKNKESIYELLDYLDSVLSDKSGKTIEDVKKRINKLSCDESDRDCIMYIIKTVTKKFEETFKNEEKIENVIKIKEEKGLKKIFESTNDEKLNFVRYAIKDFIEGAIPFYCYEPVTGKVTTHNVQIGQYMRESSDDERIDFIKKLIGKTFESVTRNKVEESERKNAGKKNNNPELSMTTRISES
ncbi:MAG: hypothetical protein K6A61_07190 [Butyrivibrio sp.]|nr:hypothetical protein [Butyrivibrio sp.]